MMPKRAMKKGSDVDQVGRSLLRICHPQCFAACTLLLGFHWKPNQQQAELDTQATGHEEKSNHIGNHQSRLFLECGEVCFSLWMQLCVCVCEREMNISIHGWDLDTANSHYDEVHRVGIVYCMKTVRSSQKRGDENVSPSGS